VFLAVRSRIDLDGRQWLIADLGGGSVEVSLADASGIRWSQSHTMGSVRLLEELAVAGDEAGRFTRLLEEYVGTLKVPPLARLDGPLGFVATGGNMETLAKLAGAEPDRRGVSVVPAKTLHRVIDTLARLSYRERVADLGLREDRADVILPAAMVYERLCKLGGLEEIHVPHVGVREGVIIDHVADVTTVAEKKDRHEEEIRTAAINFGRRFMLEETHTLHVARLALSLFDQLSEIHEMGPDERRILLAASILHDVGQYISYRKHHKHSMYLIAESELPGFSDAELLMVANVARYHRKREPAAEHEAYMKLSEPYRASVSKLAAILRIADALDREHARKVKSVKVILSDKEMILKLAGSGDMMLEMWSLERKASLFSKVFNLNMKTVIG
jgi:exopolyphosphatase/guanosine-5'-triphosphate,3'-diphosphate pyrophosphatase